MTHDLSEGTPAPRDPSAEVYREMREIAGALFARERVGHTLQPTALVHEVWLRMGSERASTDERREFLAKAAHCMRNALVDHARKRNAEKRGGGRQRETLVEGSELVEAGVVDLLDLDEALERLAARDPELARIVELRAFGGLTLEETAAATKKSLKQVRSAWDLARAFLRRELRDLE